MRCLYEYNEYNHKKNDITQKTIGQQRFQNQGKNTISSIIGGYKSAVSKHAHRLGYEFGWQSKFYDHIIRNDYEYMRIKKIYYQQSKKLECR